MFGVALKTRRADQLRNFCFTWHGYERWFLQIQAARRRTRIGIQTHMNSEAITGAPSVRKRLGLMGETSMGRNGKNTRAGKNGHQESDAHPAIGRHIEKAMGTHGGGCREE